MNVLDLFSGIGGFSLGLERAGMRTVAFCEIEPYCRRVLAKHWPNVPIYEDVRTLTADRLRADGIAVDVICGGFPCQDISVAGKGAGIEGSRSGLWSEYARIIGELRPRYVIVENVAALLSRGLGRVLGDLATLGLDAEWHCIPASAVGAPHRRDRLWIVAHSLGLSQWGSARRREAASWGPRNDLEGSSDNSVALADADHKGQPRPQGPQQQERRWIGDRSQDVADSDQPRLEGWLRRLLSECPDEWAAGDSGSFPHATHNAEDGSGARRGVSAGAWRIEPDVGRVAHGVPARVDRLRGLGNAVVPQIPEIIGRAIMRAEQCAV